MEQYLKEFSDFVTALSFIFVLKGFLTHPYTFFMRRTRLAHKGRSFVLNNFLGSLDKYTRKLFWFSVLWLIIKYQDLLRGFYEKI